MCLLVIDWLLANSCRFLVVVHISAADTNGVTSLLVNTGLEGQVNEEVRKDLQ